MPDCHRTNQRARALDGDLRVAAAGVFYRGAKLIVLDDVRVVAVLIAGVDAKEVVSVGKFMDEEVVDESAFGRHQSRIVSLADGEFRSVIATDVLDEGKSLRAFDFDFAHVADVEEPHTGAHGFVLGENAGIFDRHVPAAEIHHFGAHAPVLGIQGSLAKFSFCGSAHEKMARLT